MSDHAWIRVSDDTSMFPAFVQRADFGVWVAHGDIGADAPDLTHDRHDYSVAELEAMLRVAKGEHDADAGA